MRRWSPGGDGPGGTSNGLVGTADQLPDASLPSKQPHPDGFAIPAATRVYRFVRDGWDVVRWTRSPIELGRALFPLPRSLTKPRVLNEGPSPRGEASPASVGAILGTLKNVLQSEALVDGRVDYRRLAGSRVYEELCEQTQMLAHVMPESFHSDAERTAFWLNLYNVLSIHGVVALKIEKSVMEIPSFFVRVAYRVGPHIFALDDMLSGILRRGAPKPATGHLPFRPGDARTAYCPQTVDPRIHAGLVCAAASCPPVAYYTADQLDHQLNLAAENLVRQLVRVDRDRRVVHLPLQFYYYARDFGGPTGVVSFVLGYLSDTERPVARLAFEERWSVRWDRYDWGLNISN